MEIQLLKAKGNSGELLAAYTEWYGDDEDEDWCYLSINLINSVDVKKNYASYLPNTAAFYFK